MQPVPFTTQSTVADNLAVPPSNPALTASAGVPNINSANAPTLYTTSARAPLLPPNEEGEALAILATFYNALRADPYDRNDVIRAFNRLQLQIRDATPQQLDALSFKLEQPYPPNDAEASQHGCSLFQLKLAVCMNVTSRLGAAYKTAESELNKVRNDSFSPLDVRGFMLNKKL